jgi:hypothetical protein
MSLALACAVGSSERFQKRFHYIMACYTEEIPPPPLLKSCLDGMRNGLARTVVHIRTGHWRSAVYLTRIRKLADDRCWFCQTSARMTRSLVLLHCPSAQIRAARKEAWGGNVTRRGEGLACQSKVGTVAGDVLGAVGSGKSYC